MAVYGYIRVSTDEQVNGTSLDEQRRQITGIAMTANLDLTEIVNDPGVSGSIPILERKGGQRFANLKAGDVVIAAKLDRLFRSALDALRTIEAWEQAGVRVFINGHGEVTDQRNPSGRLMLEMMAVFAGHERRMIRERLTEGRQAKKAKGGHIGGQRPFGFNVEGSGKAAMLVPIPEEQAAIDRMVEMRRDGLSLRAISSAMQEAGFSLSHVSVGRVLESKGID